MPPCPLTWGVICFSLNRLSECSTRWSDEPTCKFFKSRLRGISRVATPLGADWPGPPPASCLPMSLTDRHTLSFSRFPTPASLSLHLCQRQGWQRRLGWKVSRAASGGETTPALLSYLWSCSCIVTLIWWQTRLFDKRVSLSCSAQDPLVRSGQFTYVWGHCSTDVQRFSSRFSQSILPAH